MTALILQFIGLAVVIIVAGTLLAKACDVLSVVTGLGGSMTGIVLMGLATSLPEVSVGCRAARISEPDLAVGDLLGASLFNLLILAVLDMTTRTGGRLLSRQAAAHALTALGSIVMAGIALLFIVMDLELPTIWRFGPGTLTLMVAYLLSLRLIYHDQTMTPAVHLESPARKAVVLTPAAGRKALVAFLLCAAAIFVAGPRVTDTAEQLAALTGLGGTFVGTVFLPLATSLPEITTTQQAVRMRSYDLAVGNILGSNTFNMLILVVVDFVYEGPLLSSVSNTHAITAACAIIVTSVDTMGMLYRVEKHYWLIEPDAILVVLLIGLSLGLVYAAR